MYYTVFGVRDTVEDSEGLSEYDTGVLASSMETFVHQYVDKWDVWIRPVTETTG